MFEFFKNKNHPSSLKPESAWQDEVEQQRLSSIAEIAKYPADISNIIKFVKENKVVEAVNCPPRIVSNNYFYYGAFSLDIHTLEFEDKIVSLEKKTRSYSFADIGKISIYHKITSNQMDLFCEVPKAALIGTLSNTEVAPCQMEELTEYVQNTVSEYKLNIRKIEINKILEHFE